MVDDVTVTTNNDGDEGEFTIGSVIGQLKLKVLDPDSRYIDGWKDLVVTGGSNTLSAAVSYEGTPLITFNGLRAMGTQATLALADEQYAGLFEIEEMSLNW